MERKKRALKIYQKSRENVDMKTSTDEQLVLESNGVIIHHGVVVKIICKFDKKNSFVFDLFTNEFLF